MHTHIHTHTHLFIYIYPTRPVDVPTAQSAASSSVSAAAYVYIYIDLYLSIYLSIYLYIYIHTYIYIYTYTPTVTNSGLTLRTSGVATVGVKSADGQHSIVYLFNAYTIYNRCLYIEIYICYPGAAPLGLAPLCVEYAERCNTYAYSIHIQPG